MSEPWVDRIKALDGMRIIRPAINCDLSAMALAAAMGKVGTADVYTVFLNPLNIEIARRLYGQHGHGIHEGAMAAPIINFIPDDRLRYVDAWALEANGIRFESDGA